jgi:transposase InsO family protein
VAHSDHGSQYTSLLYGTYAKTSSIDLSMGSIGDPWDCEQNLSCCPVAV